MRKVVAVLLVLSFLLGLVQAAFAFRLPDLKQTLTYKHRARELCLGISFEIIQKDRFSLELNLTHNFAGLAALYHWLPLIEFSSGYCIGYDPHNNRMEMGVIIFAWITW